ncbi:hypothetical protein HHI36_020019 [Cryptolaemus montrouzieri]|uniref:C2H2-type domain-containing protein n=1 Tax=Cryptolaemus montrouzieri TaxID=559131 RepID=A0ABD2N8Z2_9CUCU
MHTNEPIYAVEPDGLFSCLKCGAKYGKKYNVKRHFIYECGVEPKFQCIVCGNYPFFITETGRFGCNTCEASYKHKRHLQRHVKYECLVDPKFSCNNCGKNFKHKSHLTSHTKRGKNCNTRF